MKRVNIAAPEFELDPEDPEGFRAGLFRLGKVLGGEDSGISVYELAPGQAVCPYHYEVGEEEWLIVLAGNPTLRHPGGSEVLDPWDTVRFPKGPEGAHGIRNQTDEIARVLLFSTVLTPTATRSGSGPATPRSTSWSAATATSATTTARTAAAGDPDRSQHRGPRPGAARRRPRR
jgi:uncharacterized cupin superfamily protein